MTKKAEIQSSKVKVDLTVLPAMAYWGGSYEYILLPFHIIYPKTSLIDP
jgi:hypothetical protein